MKIVVDRNIPYIGPSLERIGETIFLKGDAIDNDVMKDTDILITRTRTKCDPSLLEGSRCSFIGTATIGTDHIDLDYCKNKGITVANAPGCNAPAVAQYVLTAITELTGNLSGKTLGIIGAGNVGTILGQWAVSVGMKVLYNDPPKEEADDRTHHYVSLDEIAYTSDVISIHTPYTTTGRHATRHLINESFLTSLNRSPLIINSARGAVTDTAALKDAFRNGKISGLAIDCWENEPHIDLELLSMATVATPHIAGYSLEGKIRATRMVLEALSGHLTTHFGMSHDIATTLTSSLPTIPPIPSRITTDMLQDDINADTRMLKEIPSTQLATGFEALRNNYNLRQEPRLLK